MVKKLFFAAVVLAGVLLLAIAVVFLVDFDSPELGMAVLEKVNETTGVELAVGRYRLNLIRGLELEEVEATTSVPNGSLKAHLDGLILKHRLLPLLTGKVAVKQIVLRRPELELTEGGAKTRQGGKPRANAGRGGAKPGQESPTGEGEPLPAEPGGGLALEISEILIEDGSIRLFREGGQQSTTSIEGLDVLLRDLSFNPRALSLIHALSAEGRLSIDSLSLDGTEVREVSGGMKLENGTLQGQDFAFHTKQGEFHAELAVDFNQIPLGYTLSLRGDPLDVNAIAGSADGGFGPGLLELEAKGFGTDSRGIKGKGVLRLAAGNLPSSPALVGVEKVLGRGTSLVGAPYQATDAPFHIENNVLTLERFQLETPQAAIDLNGSVDLDGPLALHLTLRTPREGLVIEEVPAEVLDALTNDEGWVSIPLRVTGTRDEPTVLPDSKALMAQAGQGTKRLLEQGVKSFFQERPD